MKSAAPGIILLCCLSLVRPTLTAAQQYDPQKINKKAVTFYNQGIERARDGHLVSATGLLLQAIDVDKHYVDAYLSLAGVYSELKNPQKSIDYYEAAIAIDSLYTLAYKLPYSISLAGAGEFEKALAAITDLLNKKPPKNEKSLKAAQYRKSSYEFAVAYSKKNTLASYTFSPQNVGPAINSAELEYFPSLTIDGNELVFTRRLNGSNEDFFVSTKENGEWQTARPMTGDINTPQNEGAQNISQDGEWLVLTGCNRPDGFGSCDIYISYKQKDGWSRATNVGSRINTDQWESQPCLSPDKRALYFASRRFGGYGGSDIYVSYLQDNGKWGEPENMGPTINTPGDEQCPFIHADNQTLYFTSNYWPGYGDDDIFLSRKGPKGDWSQPINLGYPINTIDREGTLFVAADGKTAYYSSDKAGTKGGLDIFSFELRDDIRPYKTLWVKGKVLDKETGKGLPSAVELRDLATNRIINNVQTDEQGNYLITLPTGKDYSFNVSRSGYLFYSDNFLLSQSSPDSTYTKNIPLQAIAVNAAIVLNNIFFAINEFELMPASTAELDKVIQLLQLNPTLKIEIGGHTDNTGKAADNLTLSNNRARAVVRYLTDNGIPVARLTAKGYGPTQPVADNNSDEGKAKNRRTELKVISQ